MKYKFILLAVTLGVCVSAGPACAADVKTYVFGQSYPLPDTGQTKCYNTSTEIACPAHGADSEQDGSYNPSATQPSYRDNGDFTITDNRTGLMWKKCSEGQNNDATCTGTAATYLWMPALLQCTGLTTPGGYNDWRLPNVNELMSIINYGAAVPPYINTTYFPNTKIDIGYWTSTTDVVNPTLALSPNFNVAYVYQSSKTTLYGNVRCVRGGPK